MPGQSTTAEGVPRLAKPTRRFPSARRFLYLNRARAVESVSCIGGWRTDGVLARMQCRTDDDVIPTRSSAQCDASLTPTQGSDVAPRHSQAHLRRDAPTASAFGVPDGPRDRVSIALGSGFTAFAAWLEMSDLQFFKSWPLQVLMILLVLTLATGDVDPHPVTPPRCGVWTIHAASSCSWRSQYYTPKVRRARTRTVHQADPSTPLLRQRQQSQLYVKVNGTLAAPSASLHNRTSRSQRGSEDADSRRARLAAVRRTTDGEAATDESAKELLAGSGR